jgi:hypothetical protein
MHCEGDAVTRPNAELKDAMEAWVDSNSLADLLYIISGIAFDKSEHIHSNWQDKTLADQWCKASMQISALAERLHKARL